MSVRSIHRLTPGVGPPQNMESTEQSILEDSLDWPELKRGDDAAWRTFFERFDTRIRDVLNWRKWGFEAGVRDELFHEIRGELTRSLHRYRGDCPLTQFIKRICVNRCIDRIRRAVRERSLIAPPLPERDGEPAREAEAVAGASYDPVRQIVMAEQAAGLQALLGRLDATCVAAIRLFYVEGLAYKDIAERLDISINTVGSRLAKCLEKLRGMARHDVFFRDEIIGPRD